MRATEFIIETAMMGKIADSGKIIRILKKAHTVPFSDEKNWLLVDTDPGKGNSGLGIKWIPADTRFEWVRPYRDTVDENLSPQTIHKLADRKGVKWDNEPSFLQLTKRLTGKEHLDDLDHSGLNKVKRHLDGLQGVAEEGYGTHPSQRVDPRTGKKYVPPRSPLGQGVAEGSINEASSDEAWELVGQPVPEIQQFVKQMGYGNDEQSIAKITSIIDRVPATQIPAASIPKLKNLANKGNDAQTLKSILQISGRPDAEQQYTKLMQARDAAEGRNRDVSGYIQYVKSGNYDPPVLLKLPTGVYVIGGRTRLYAALALGVPANVKIISVNNFKQGVAEGWK